jgi:hypothetical protein
MFFSKLSTVVAFLLVLVILLSSNNHIIYTQAGRPLTMMHRRFSLLSHSDEAGRGTMSTPAGTISPDGTGNGGAGGGVLGEDTRSTDPGHSPGAGHAATNNVVN